MGRGHPGGDVVLDPVQAFPRRLQYQLGIEFRIPDRPPTSPDLLLPARYLRIQVASPPPRRVDDSRWFEGLRVYDDDGGDREFDPDAPWKQSTVLPLEGISPFGQPPPGTIVCDQWVGVPAVPPTEALTTAFTLIAPDKPDVPSNHFLSVPYPRPTIDGVELEVAGVNYYTEGVLDFPQPQKVGAWIAVSFDRFWPPERASADYIVAVPRDNDVAVETRLGVTNGDADTAPLAPYPIDPAW
jgi:hypothetical protein